MKFIKLKMVMDRTSLSKSHVYALSRAGLFPKPVKLSKHSSAWVLSEVEEWLQERMDERNNVEGKK